MATYTNFNNEIFAQNALNGFVAELLPLEAFSTNFSPDAVAKGDTVLVPLIGALTATTFGGSYATSGGSMSAITVTINRHKVVQIGQDDLTAANSSMASLEKFAYQQGAALAIAVLQDIFTLCTTANFAIYTTVSLAGLDVPQLRAARLALNKANVPKIPRSLIVDCDGYDALLGVTNFVQAHMFGDRSAIAEARIPRAIGLDLFELNSLFPASIGAIAAHASAVAIAIRYLRPQRPERYDDARAVAHPSGATFGLRDHYDPNTGNRYVNLECNYGYSAGITQGARLLKRTDA